MIPSNLVEKIIKGQYIDLCNLLQDNILLSKKSGSGNGSTFEVGYTQHYKKREFTKDDVGLLSWIQCFVVYTTISVFSGPQSHE